MVNTDSLYITSTSHLSSLHLLGFEISRQIGELAGWHGISVKGKCPLPAREVIRGYAGKNELRSRRASSVSRVENAEAGSEALRKNWQNPAPMTNPRRG